MSLDKLSKAMRENLMRIENQAASDEFSIDSVATCKSSERRKRAQRKSKQVATTLREEP